MSIEIKDIASIASIIVALALGIYNIIRTRRVSYIVDSILLDDKRYESLQIAIDIETIRTRMKTTAKSLRFKLRSRVNWLSDEGKIEISNAIEKIDNLLNVLDKEISEDREFVASTRNLTAPTFPEPNVLQMSNTMLGKMKTRLSEAILEQANTDGFISDAENLLTAAELQATQT